jgi:hypothetical protein
LKINETLPKSLGKQWRHSTIMNQTKVKDIKVKFNSNVPSAWKTATRYAFARWNEISGSVIKFREVSSGQNLTISYGALSPSTTIARASFPTTSGNVGPTVKISTNHNGLSSSKKNFTMVHELGHCIGMRHINNSESGRIKIPGTSTTDNNSVMNPTVKSWGGFSSGDITAARVVYPITGKYVIVYQDKNYSGKKYYIASGHSVNKSELQSAGLHDRISSIKTFGGAKLTLYRNSNYSSDNMLITGNKSNLKTYDFNDKVSSIRWTYPSGKYAILYRHKDYTGRPFTVTGSRSNLSSYGFNDKTSSVRLYNGAKVRLYKDKNYSSSSYYISSNRSNLNNNGFNDKASSVRLY